MYYTTVRKRTQYVKRKKIKKSLKIRDFNNNKILKVLNVGANNNAATNTVFKVIDELYPDEYMQVKFPKMKVITK